MKSKIIATLNKTSTKYHLEVTHGLEPVRSDTIDKETSYRKSVLSKLFALIIDYLKAHPEINTILEIGCGYGEEARFLKEALENEGLEQITVYATDAGEDKYIDFTKAHSFVKLKPAEDFKDLGKDILALSLWAYISPDTLANMSDFDSLLDEEIPDDIKDPRDTYFVTKFMRDNPHASMAVFGSKFHSTGIMAINYTQLEKYERYFFTSEGCAIQSPKDYIEALNAGIKEAAIQIKREKPQRTQSLDHLLRRLKRTEDEIFGKTNTIIELSDYFIEALWFLKAELHYVELAIIHPKS